MNVMEKDRPPGGFAVGRAGLGWALLDTAPSKRPKNVGRARGAGDGLENNGSRRVPARFGLEPGGVQVNGGDGRVVREVSAAIHQRVRGCGDGVGVRPGEPEEALRALCGHLMRSADTWCGKSSCIADAKERYGAAELSRAAARRRGRRLWDLALGPVGVNWQQMPEPSPRWSLGYHLETLSCWAAGQGSAVLLTVDEMRAGDRDELRRLASDVQDIAKARGFPLAFVGPGLPEMAHTVLEDKKMTFFHRCSRDKMSSIAHDKTWRCLRVTVEESNGAVHDGALRLMAAAAADGLPYKLQSIGHHAWESSGSPERPIDDQAAETAVELAGQDMADKVVSPMWHDLGESDARRLATVRRRCASAQRARRGRFGRRGRCGCRVVLRRLWGSLPASICAEALSADVMAATPPVARPLQSMDAFWLWFGRRLRRDRDEPRARRGEGCQSRVFGCVGWRGAGWWLGGVDGVVGVVGDGVVGQRGVVAVGVGDGASVEREGVLGDGDAVGVGVACGDGVGEYQVGGG